MSTTDAGNALTRRGLAMAGLAAACGLAAPAVHKARAAAPEFTLKLGHDMPVDHPINVRSREAVKEVAEKSGGRLVIQVFPNNQLGGDTDMMSQLRSGALPMMLLSGNIMSTILPVSGMYNLPFAFANYDQVWATMDGPLGNFLRERVNGIGLHALDKHWNNGFRQMTSSERKITGPADLKGFKMRTPVAPLWLSMFKAFGAAPTPINFSEVYSALQTHVVDGEENPLTIIETAKLFEVQKYCAMTSHIWDGWYTLINGRTWKKLPADLQKIVADAFNAAAVRERQDVIEEDAKLRTTMAKQGMEFTEPNRDAFREVLLKAGFYTEWKRKYGDKAWSLLEQTAAKLA